MRYTVPGEIKAYNACHDILPVNAYHLLRHIISLPNIAILSYGYKFQWSNLTIITKFFTTKFLDSSLK